MDNRASKSGVGETDYRKSLFGTSSSTAVGSKKYEKLRHDEEEGEALMNDTLQQQQRVMAMQVFIRSIDWLIECDVYVTWTDNDLT